MHGHEKLDFSRVGHSPHGGASDWLMYILSQKQRTHSSFCHRRKDRDREKRS
jgi:hypothetical protein